MKRILLTLAALCVMAASQAQFYNIGSAKNSGRLNLYAGFGIPNSEVTIYAFNTNQHMWYEAQTDELTFNPGFAFHITMSNPSDISENFKLGMYFDLGYMKTSWEAKVPSVIPGNFWTLNMKSNSMTLGMGAEGELLFAEKIGLSFAAAPYVEFHFGQKGKVDPPLEDKDDEWHNLEKDGSDMPNIDFGFLARVGANYHFTENLWAGLSFQYNIPFGSTDGSDPKEAKRKISSLFSETTMKRQGWALLLNFGIDIQ